MTPSKSTLDRLPKALSLHWEADRVPFEATLQEAEPSTSLERSSRYVNTEEEYNVNMRVTSKWL